MILVPQEHLPKILIRRVLLSRPYHRHLPISHAQLQGQNSNAFLGWRLHLNAWVTDKSRVHPMMEELVFGVLVATPGRRTDPTPGWLREQTGGQVVMRHIRSDAKISGMVLGMGQIHVLH